MVWWATLLLVILGFAVFFVGAKAVMSCFHATNRHWADWNGKYVVVTGGTSGIGRATAEALILRGACVVLTGRDSKAVREEIVPEIVSKIGKLSDLERDNLGLRGAESDFANGDWDQAGNFTSKRLLFRQFDFSDLSQVKSFTDWVKRRNFQLAAIVNNAGGFFPNYLETKQGLEMNMGLHHFAHYYMTDKLLPILNSQGRVVTVASHGSNFSAGGSLRSPVDFDKFFSEFKKENYDSMGANSLSKLANVLFTRGLQRYFDSKQIASVASSLNPGAVRSGIWARGGFKLFAVLLYPIWWAFFKTSEQGSQTILHCLNAPAFEMETGSYYHECSVDKRENPIARDGNEVEKFMQISKRITERLTSEKMVCL